MTAPSPAPPQPPTTSGGPIRLADAYRFFLPLVFMVELNMISKSVIHAFLARTAAPSVTLAAFNVSFTFFYAITSATEVMTLLSLSYLDERRRAPHIVKFFVLVLSGPMVVGELVAFTPLGDWLYGTVFGASPAAVAEAKSATFYLSLSVPVLMLRALAFALLMRARRTLFITLSTLVRLLSLAVSLAFLPRLLEGAPVGAAALAACMAFETAFAWIFAWPEFRRLTARLEAPLPSYGEFWRFTWPLVLNQAAELGVVLVINLFLGRLSRPDLALAAFGVVHGLVGLIMAPMRNLAQTAQTLVSRSEDARVLLRFALQLAAAFAALALVLFHTPLSAWILGRVMGLTPEMHAYCAPAMKLAFAMALFWAMAALFRGLLAGRRTTTVLAATGALRLGAAAVLGSATVLAPGVNGAVLGLSAWILAYAVESGVLSWRYLRASPR